MSRELDEPAEDAAALVLFLYAAKLAVTSATKALVAVTAAVAIVALVVHLA